MDQLESYAGDSDNNESFYSSASLISGLAHSLVTNVLSSSENGGSGEEDLNRNTSDEGARNPVCPQDDQACASVQVRNQDIMNVSDDESGAFGRLPFERMVGRFYSQSEYLFESELSTQATEGEEKNAFGTRHLMGKTGGQLLTPGLGEEHVIYSQEDVSHVQQSFIDPSRHELRPIHSQEYLASEVAPEQTEQTGRIQGTIQPSESMRLASPETSLIFISGKFKGNDSEESDYDLPPISMIPSLYIPYTDYPESLYQLTSESNASVTTILPRLKKSCSVPHMFKRDPQDAIDFYGRKMRDIVSEKNLRRYESDPEAPEQISLPGPPVEEEESVVPSAVPPESTLEWKGASRTSRQWNINTEARRSAEIAAKKLANNLSPREELYLKVADLIPPEYDKHSLQLRNGLDDDGGYVPGMNWGLSPTLPERPPCRRPELAVPDVPKTSLVHDRPENRFVHNPNASPFYPAYIRAEFADGVTEEFGSTANAEDDYPPRLPPVDEQNFGSPRLECINLEPFSGSGLSQSQLGYPNHFQHHTYIQHSNLFPGPDGSPQLENGMGYGCQFPCNFNPNPELECAPNSQFYFIQNPTFEFIPNPCIPLDPNQSAFVPNSCMQTLGYGQPPVLYREQSIIPFDFYDISADYMTTNPSMLEPVEEDQLIFPADSTSTTPTTSTRLQISEADLIPTSVADLIQTPEADHIQILGTEPIELPQPEPVLLRPAVSQTSNVYLGSLENTLTFVSSSRKKNNRGFWKNAKHNGTPGMSRGISNNHGCQSMKSDEWINQGPLSEPAATPVPSSRRQMPRQYINKNHSQWRRLITNCNTGTSQTPPSPVSSVPGNPGIVTPTDEFQSIENPSLPYEKQRPNPSQNLSSSLLRSGPGKRGRNRGN